ncbi:MAG: hypothetical protein HC887_09140 [Desulfobacteraceae bacterium]|nr:hypothetical protein [Desulfobacteraceae bacterium]
MKKIEIVCPECGNRNVSDADDRILRCEKCGCCIDDELCEVPESLPDYED